MQNTLDVADLGEKHRWIFPALYLTLTKFVLPYVQLTIYRRQGEKMVVLGPPSDAR